MDYKSACFYAIANSCMRDILQMFNYGVEGGFWPLRSLVFGGAGPLFGVW